MRHGGCFGRLSPSSLGSIIVPASKNPNLDSLRQSAQLDFIASGAPLIIGDLTGTPFTREQLLELRTVDADLAIDSGLSAEVLRISAGSNRWTLKRARAESKVRNVDGDTAFLNEIQRRIDHAQLKSKDPERWGALVDTCWGSFRDGLLLSPWIEGAHPNQWNERQLSQVLKIACALWLEGLFEWDLCAGNLLDDGSQIRLFDFGYQYRFDPLTQFSSAGRGYDVTLFHPAERFESRCYCAYLLQLEQEKGQDSALAAFRLEKGLALEAYSALRSHAANRGAQGHILHWLDDFASRWRIALRGDAHALYLAESWRSHALDLEDDLRGKSCTPMTLRRADWLLNAIQKHGDALSSQQAFFGYDRGMELPELRARYATMRRQAEGYQLERNSKSS
jgi:hypothetical protein